MLPMNIITGLWGMNVLVPGQEAPGLTWFYSSKSDFVYKLSFTVADGTMQSRLD